MSFEYIEVLYNRKRQHSSQRNVWLSAMATVNRRNPGKICYLISSNEVCNRDLCLLLAMARWVSGQPWRKYFLRPGTSAAGFIRWAMCLMRCQSHYRREPRLICRRSGWHRLGSISAEKCSIPKLTLNLRHVFLKFLPHNNWYHDKRMPPLLNF